MAIWPDAGRHGGLPPPPGGCAPPRPAADYSAYTPEFAARLRRMDQDRSRAAMQAGAGGPGPVGAAAAGPVWIRRPPEPVAVLPPGSRRMARGDVRQARG